MQGRLGLRRNRHRDLPKAEVSVGVADTALAGGRRTSRQLRGLFSQHLPSPNHLLPQVAAVCDGSCFSLRLFSWVLANCLEPDKVPRKQSVPWGPSGVEGSVYVTPARTAVGSQALTRAALPGLRRCRPGSPFCDRFRLRRARRVHVDGTPRRRYGRLLRRSGSAILWRQANLRQ